MNLLSLGWISPTAARIPAVADTPDAEVKRTVSENPAVLALFDAHRRMHRDNAAAQAPVVIESCVATVTLDGHIVVRNSRPIYRVLEALRDGGWVDLNTLPRPPSRATVTTDLRRGIEKLTAACPRLGESISVEWRSPTSFRVRAGVKLFFTAPVVSRAGA